MPGHSISRFFPLKSVKGETWKREKYAEELIGNCLCS